MCAGFSQNDGIATLKGELIPYIVKKQMARPKVHTSDGEKGTLSVVNVSVKHDDIFHYVTNGDLEQKITETSLFNESDNRSPFSGDIIRCYALHPQENCFGIRVNTVLSYCTINQKLFDLWDKIFRTSNAPPLVSPHSIVKSTQMTSCAVADHANISEKTSLKNCTLGAYAKVNMKTRIANSVLMNGVVIHEGYALVIVYYAAVRDCIFCDTDPDWSPCCFVYIFLYASHYSVVIENCVICDKAVIQSGCVLKNCLVGPNHEVAEDTTKEKAHLTNSDVFMEIE